jgi:competence protein ComEA
MARSDDALRRITRDRLQAVARPDGTRTTSSPRGPADDGTGEHDVGAPLRWPPERPPTGAPGHDVVDDLLPSRRADGGWPWAGGQWLEQEPEPESEPEPEPEAEPGSELELEQEPGSPPVAALAAGRVRHRARHAMVTERGPASSPESADTPTSGPAADDVRDVVERMRREALSEVAAQYSQRHGHPLDHPSMDGERGRRRWFLTVRHAVVAGVAVALLTAGVVVRATAGVPETVPPPGDPPASASEATAATSADSPSATGPPPGPGAVPGEAAAPSTGSAAGTPEATEGGGAGSTASPVAGVVVHVVGQVHTPGVVELPAGSRVADALRAAGGATDGADLSAVNLARVLVDGEQVVVPAPGEAPAAAAGSGRGSVPGGAPGTAGGPAVVDLNAAGLAELDALPGIGPVLAQRILDWRTDNGPFRDVEELGEVAGIGETLLGRIRPMVAV